MTQATYRDYWISPTALTFSLNALDNPDYMQVSLTSGAVILCYMKGIEGLGYDDGHNYRRWLLTGDSVAFGSQTGKYVYVRIPRTPESISKDPLCADITPVQDQLHAQLCYPSEKIDIYGCTHTHDGYEDDEITQIGVRAYFYIFLGGKISEVITDESSRKSRKWLQNIQQGYLSSDEALAAGPTDSEWYQYSAIDEITTFLKDLTMKAGTKFHELYAKALTIVSGGEIGFGDKNQDGTYSNGSVEKVAEFGSLSDESPKQIVTPKYIKDRETEVEKKYLRKDQNDKTDFDLEMKNLKVNGKADVFGNTTVFGNFVAESTSHLKGDVTIGTPSPSGRAGVGLQLWGKSEWGTFIKGIITGSGAQIDSKGNAELESLIIRRFLEVPELRYNRVSVHSGTEWFTKGSGLIESVEPIDDTHGKVKLHLEDGEISTIAEDDYCMGIFHNLNGNAEKTTDDKQGNMAFAGFTTVYFRIQEITETAHNSEFIYELRPADSYQGSLAMGEGGGRRPHPQPQMSFACYANPNREDRQSAVLKTTDYTVYIEKSTQWTFGPENYYLIIGNLEGFSVWATRDDGKRYLKKLHGRGQMLQNLYVYGDFENFKRLADIIEVTASPRINADYSLADGETMTLTVQMLSYDGIKRTGVVYTIKRYSDNPESDTEWNKRRGSDIKDGTIALTTEDTRISEGVFDPAVQFTIVATRQLPSDEGGEDYSVERDIVVKNAGNFTLTDDNADPMIAEGEAKYHNFHVKSPRGGDITSKVERWSIERHSSDPTADTLWAMRDKVKAFAGSIALLWSSDPTENDMDPNETISGTSFLITAYIGTEPIAQEEITL